MSDPIEPGWYTREGLSRAHYYNERGDSHCTATWTDMRMVPATPATRRCDTCAGEQEAAERLARIGPVAVMVDLGADPQDAPAVVEHEAHYTRAWLNGDWGHYRTPKALIQFLCYALIKRGGAAAMADNAARRRGEKISALRALAEEIKGQRGNADATETERWLDRLIEIADG